MGLAIPGHNMPFVLFGCLLTLIGWMGLDSAAAMLFAGAPVASVPLIAVNNLAAASVALLTALVVTRLRYGKPDASIAANGFVIGLVAISGACSLVSPPSPQPSDWPPASPFPFRSSGLTASAATIPAAPSPCMLSEACGVSSPPVFSSIPVPASGWPRQR